MSSSPSPNLSNKVSVSEPQQKTALVVVDVQHDFVDGSLAVPGADGVLPRIQDLICAHGKQGMASPWDLVVITRDDHPTQHVSFASTHGLAPFRQIKIASEDGQPIKQMLWPDHCLHDSHGAELIPTIRSALDDLRSRPNAPEIVDLPKGQLHNEDFYSAFASVGYTAFTPLVRILAQARIERLVVCGLATDYCVRSTAVDARKFGFNTLLAHDAATGVAKDTENAALEQMRRRGCELVDTSSLLARLNVLNA